jgi:ribosomal protein L14
MFFEKQIPYLMKIRQVGAKMSHADGQAYRQTDNTTKLIVVLRNCAKGTKISGAVGRKMVQNYQDIRRHKPEDNSYY